jgi:acetate---CoA ligase (ADP-forming)
MKHRLDPLLRPRSVAVVGASAREDTMGDWALRNLLRGGYAGAIWPVNPGYDELQGLRCHASLSALPGVPDLVIFAVGDQHVERVVDEAIALGVSAVVIMSTLVLEDDREPPLKERIGKKIREAGMLACGANGMGYYNVRDGVWACGFDSRMHRPPGKIALISHSGSGMSGIIDSDERLAINFAVSTGNELAVAMDEYLDFALDLPETRAVGLFIETARNPEGFRRALAKANDKRVPVVALKVGRTARSAALTVSHSGAMAGDDAAYEALFDRYGVERVRDMDELATALILFAELGLPGPGGLVTLHDSGGERQLFIDLADEAGVPLAELGHQTVAELEKVLDPELPAVNPLDAWSRGGTGAADVMTRCLTLMMQDPAAAMGAVVHDRAPDGLVYPGYVEYMRGAHAATGKPVALVAARQGTGSEPLAVQATQEGFPVLDGVPAFLRGVKALFAYRDFLATPEASAPAVDDAKAETWRARLATGALLDEAESLTMLRDFGIPANSCRIVEDEAALEGCRDLPWPRVLKTATPGLLHKTEHGGVILGIGNEAELLDAWRAIAARLGPRTLVAPMVAAGVEMILGARRDPQFGPVVMFGFGGIFAEVLGEVAFALPPFDAGFAKRKLAALRLRPLLDGARGSPACDVEAFCDTAARFSAMVHALGGALEEIDINPIILGAEGCVAADALAVGRRASGGE